jgi:hypothetical protein
VRAPLLPVPWGLLLAAARVVLVAFLAATEAADLLYLFFGRFSRLEAAGAVFLAAALGFMAGARCPRSSYGRD